MIEFIDNLDKQWLLALNNDYSAFWDGIMVAFSEKITWFPLYLSIIYIIIRKWKKESWWLIAALILSVVIADQIASGVIKEWVARLRPSHDPSLAGQVVLVNGYKSGLYGFVSSHAANSFAIALLSSLFFRKRTYTIFIFLWAILNSYSRIYLGVHYLGDILGGAIVGILVALFFYWLVNKFRPALQTGNSSAGIKTTFPVTVFLVTCAVLVAYSIWFF